MAEEMAAGRPPDSNPDRTGGGDPRTLIVDSNPGKPGAAIPGQPEAGRLTGERSDGTTRH